MKKVFVHIVFTVIYILLFSCTNDAKVDYSENKLSRNSFHCLLDSLSLNDTLYIANESSGCFHYTMDSIKIYYQSDTLHALLTVRDIGYEDIQSITNYLSYSSIDAYSKFETFVKTFKPDTYYSTSQHRINVQYKETSYSFESSDSGIEEYNNLILSLFGKTKVDQLYSKLYHVHKNK